MFTIGAGIALVLSFWLVGPHLKDAPIWLLDEITANLDPITAVHVLQAVLTAGTNRTIILMTHRTQLLANHTFAQHIHLE